VAGNLSERLRGIVSGAVPRVAPLAVASRPSAVDGTNLYTCANVLGGAVIERPEGAIVVVDRFYAPDRLHGRERIGAMAETLTHGQSGLETLGAAWPAGAGATPGRGLVFIDLETTGIAGGAGTYAFLVGCASVEDDGIRVRQFLLPGYEHERALLIAVCEWYADRQSLVSFNGRSFDVPLIETRFLYHRLRFPFDDCPHVDMLHTSRRLWKQRPSIAGPPLDDDSCKLSVLERHLAGVHRVGDVPGFEIPSRFFRFVRDGDAYPLEAVLEHNRIDLLSLALVTARAIRLIENGPADSRHPQESLGLGRLYERAGRADDAEASYAHAVTLAGRVGREPDVHAEALRRLALRRRRSGRFADAAQAWQQLAALPSCPSVLRREAREALAIHHEHRIRDFETARAFVLDALAETPATRWRERAEYRLRRINRKLEERSTASLFG
jgi:uncharacterized protein YprB with RNaseH-like and TPR domain